MSIKLYSVDHTAFVDYMYGVRRAGGSDTGDARGPAARRAWERVGARAVVRGLQAVGVAAVPSSAAGGVDRRGSCHRLRCTRDVAARWVRS